MRVVGWRARRPIEIQRMPVTDDLFSAFQDTFARMISSMLKPTVIRVRKRMRGNPDWGKFPRAIPALQTEFEKQVTRLGLAKSEYMYSAELKHWCDRNRNRVYVPEWLLDEWGMTVEAIFSSVA
jgi:hypothetical protein